MIVQDYLGQCDLHFACSCEERYKLIAARAINTCLINTKCSPVSGIVLVGN